MSAVSIEKTSGELKSLLRETLLALEASLVEQKSDSLNAVESMVTQLKEVTGRLSSPDDPQSGSLVALVDDLTSFLRQFGDPSSQSYISVPEAAKLTIVWDLDLCLLKSVEINKSGEKELESTVVERFGGVLGRSILHVDDDCYTYKTYLRGWARFMLAFLKPFVNHFVFTSATHGYMENVVSLVEGVSKAGEGGKKSNVLFFEPKQLSQSSFPAGHLRMNGKSVAEFKDQVQEKLSSSTSKQAVQKAPLRLNRCILIDDQPRYHMAQPFNGILVDVMKTATHSLTDLELLLMIPMLTTLIISADDATFYEALFRRQGKQYWRGLLLQIVKVIDIDAARADLPSLSKDHEAQGWKYLENEFQNYFSQKEAAAAIPPGPLMEEIRASISGMLEHHKDSLLAAFRKRLEK